MTFGGFQKTDLINFPGLVASTVFTRGCNFRCPYCHNPEFVIQGSDQTYFGETYTDEEILSYLKKRAGLLDGLVITGGEPTLHADLPDFIREVRAIGLKVKLDTNGGRPDVLHSLLESGLLDYVAMDIKAPLDKYDLLGFNSPKAIEKSVKILNASDLDHEFRTTCVKAIITEDDFPKMAALIGPDAKWYLQPFNPAKTLDPQYGSESTYSAAELKQIASDLHRDNTFVR
jgi:pyruvate formate lyase activating enzyme